MQKLKSMHIKEKKTTWKAQHRREKREEMELVACESRGIEKTMEHRGGKM